jgi:hypothetical protein
VRAGGRVQQLSNIFDICPELARLNDIVFNDGRTKLIWLQENHHIPAIMINGKIMSAADVVEHIIYLISNVVQLRIFYMR